MATPRDASFRSTLVAACAATALVTGAVTYLLTTRKRNPYPSVPVPPPQNAAHSSSSSSSNGSSYDNNVFVLLPHEHEEKMKQRLLTAQTRGDVESENETPRRSVTVRVPATSANMGPGFDCLGCAVDLWTLVTVERADKFEIICQGEGAVDMPTDESNYVVEGLRAAFAAAGVKDIPTLKYTIDSHIPFARGLGSSSAGIVAGIIAGLVLAGHRLPCWGSEALLQIAATIEGHPDNVAPAIYGGIQVGIHNGSRWVTERIPTPPGLQMVVFIPDFIGKTSTARGVLGPTVSRKDASFNVGRVAYLVNALCQCNLDCLRDGVGDALHQPARAAALYPYLNPLIAAAEKAGANACYLSGAGPTVMALTSGASGDIFTQRVKERSDMAVASAMMEAAKLCGVKGKVIITNISNEGARVVKVEPPFSTDRVGITYKGDV